MSRTIADARDIFRKYGRNAGDSSRYSDAQVDMGMRTLFTMVADDLRYLATASDVTLGTSNASISLTNLAGIEPFRVFDILFDGVEKPVVPGDYSEIHAEKYRDNRTDSSFTGHPQLMAFLDPGTLEVWPPADQEYDGKLRWYAPFTIANWTMGGSGSNGDSLTIPLPDAWVDKICTTALPALVQYQDVEDQKTISGQAWYKDLIASLKAAGTLGARRAQRMGRSDYERQRGRCSPVFMPRGGRW